MSSKNVKHRNNIEIFFDLMILDDNAKYQNDSGDLKSWDS